MATLDNSDNIPEEDRQLSKEEIENLLAKQQLSWSLREKNYLAELTMMQRVNYEAYKRKIRELHQHQLYMIHEELYLHNLYQKKVFQTMLKSQLTGDSGMGLNLDIKPKE